MKRLAMFLVVAAYVFVASLPAEAWFRLDLLQDPEHEGAVRWYGSNADYPDSVDKTPVSPPLVRGEQDGRLHEITIWQKNSETGVVHIEHVLQDYSIQ